MKFFLPILGSLLFLGCSPMGSDSALNSPPDYREGPLWDEEDNPGSAGSDDDDDAETSPTIAWLSPAPGDTEHHYRTPIQVGFGQPSRGADVILKDGDGLLVEATVDWYDDWSVAKLRPERFLDPLTSYSIEIRLGRTELGYEFSTSEVGLAPEDPTILEGRTYALDLANAEWGPLGQAIQASNSTASWLLQVHQTSDPTVEAGTFYFDLGFGPAGDTIDVQDTCAASGRLGDPLQDTTRSNAYFSSEVADATVLVGDVAVLVESGRIEGDFLADGSALTHVAYQGWVSEDSLAEVIPDSCAASADLNVACEPCPSGRGQCHFLYVSDLEAAHLPALDVSNVDLAAVLEGDECEGGSAVLACSAAATPAAGWLFFLPLLLRRRR